MLNPKPVGAVSSTLFCKLSPATVSVWALEFTPVQVLLKALAEVLESAGHWSTLTTTASEAEQPLVAVTLSV